MSKGGLTLSGCLVDTPQSPIAQKEGPLKNTRLRNTEKRKTL